MAAATKLELFVVDSSIILSSILPDEILPIEINSIVRKFTHNLVKFIAPPIMVYEVGNALRSSVKQNRLDINKASGIYTSFLSLPISFINNSPHSIFQASIKHNLTFYDASYLVLAEEKNAKLLTLDKKLLTCLQK